MPRKASLISIQINMKKKEFNYKKTQKMDIIKI